MVLFLGLLYAQVEMNFSLEVKDGNGQQATTSDTTAYYYFENLLDINTYIGNDIYIYTQLEYSAPPVFGYRRTHIDSILNTLYIEYAKDRYNIKIGDIYELYGRGLSYYTFQDQNIDYNNSVRGLNLHYFLKDNVKLSALFGTSEYAFRSLPSNRITNYHFNTNIGLGAIDYENQLLGYFQAIYLVQESFFPADRIYANSTLIESLCNEDNELGEELRKTASIKTVIVIDGQQFDGNCYTLGQYPYTVNTNNFNLTWNYFLGPLEIYIDKAWIYYDKIHAEEVFGSRFYTSIYTELLKMGITYEYKNYFTPYLIKSMSNPPIVYREGASILASRNVHSINFGNEIGHQIDINKNLFENVNMAANLSLSHRLQMGSDLVSISLHDILSMKDEDYMYDYFPFRQMYLEINGWALSERLYYKLGVDHFTEFIKGQNISAFTIPTHWVWKLSNRSSLTMYLETQIKSIKRLLPAEYTNHYISSSYSHGGKWIVTVYFDQEIKDLKSANEWIGTEFSYNMNAETQISYFYGSQKGGLVCSNGICAEQPGFEDGYKITLRSLF